MKIKQLLKYFLRQNNEEIIDATRAYQITTYSKQYTREELKKELIKDLNKRIKEDSKTFRNYLSITTYSGYREKQILPEVAEFFREKNYNVTLHNEEDYSDVNVLIINWQKQEKF